MPTAPVSILPAASEAAAPDAPASVLGAGAENLIVTGSVAGFTLPVTLVPTGMLNGQEDYSDTGDLETALVYLSFDLYEDGKWRVESTSWSGESDTLTGTYTAISGFSGSVNIAAAGITAPAAILGTVSGGGSPSSPAAILGTVSGGGSPSSPAAILGTVSGGGSPSSPAAILGTVSGGGSPSSPAAVLSAAAGGASPSSPKPVLQPTGGWPGAVTDGGDDLTDGDGGTLTDG